MPWWICHYPTPRDLDKNAPCEVVGPYNTQAQAVRALNGASFATVRSDLATG